MILFAASLSFSDYLRSKILTGFPWNLWAYSTTSINEILQIVNLIGLHSYNLLIITVFTLPLIIFFKINKIYKLLSITITLSIIFVAFVYGNYVININKNSMKGDIEKTYIKIISPNFDLKYGLTIKEIEERFRKLIRYSDPDREKNIIHLARGCI